MNNVFTVYIARSVSPFDPGTEAELLEDYRSDGAQAGLFLGWRNGKLIEIYCQFNEFDIKREQA